MNLNDVIEYGVPLHACHGCRCDEHCWAWVRHWVAGRSFPGKRHAPQLEAALSFNLDYTEGASRKPGREDASTMMERHDVELMLLIAKLEPEMKVALKHLVEACLSAQRGPRPSFVVHEKPAAVKPFFDKTDKGTGIDKRSRKRASS